jgi:hypothetical protein
MTSKSVGTGPSYYEKIIYRAVASQSLRNSGLNIALFHPTDEGNTLLSNVGTYLPAETTKHHRILAASNNTVRTSNPAKLSKLSSSFVTYSSTLDFLRSIYRHIIFCWNPLCR